MNKNVITSKKTLVFSVGIQGSGKSTYFKDKSPVIETDSIRKALFNNVDNISDEKRVFDTAMDKILTAFQHYDTAYLDATMVETKHREQFLTELKERVPNINLVGMVFTVSKELAKERIQRDLDNDIDRADSVKFVDEYFEYMEETMCLIRQEDILFKAVMVDDGDKTHNMAACMLSILDSLKLYDTQQLILDDETLSEMMFRKMDAYNIDLNKELGFTHLKPITKKL